jgi:hypothetical protein
MIALVEKLVLANDSIRNKLLKFNLAANLSKPKSLNAKGEYIKPKDINYR